MCPDLIHRYISNILTIDQIETLTNKNIDGDLNTLTDIAQTSLKQITDKAKLPDDIVYAGTPYTQSVTHHTDVLLDGLMDGQVLKWDSTLGKWKNVTPQVETAGDITGAANLTGTGATIFASEVAGILNFNRIRSMSTSALSIANSANEVQLTLTDSSTIAKGVVQLCTSGEESSTKAVMGTDSRLSNSRNPLAHKTSHQAGGADSIKLDDLVAPDDNTDLNASVNAHGLMMKYPNNTTQFLRADGTWQSPPVPSVGVVVLKKEVSELYIASDSSERTMISHSVGGGTLGTDGVLRLTLGGVYYNGTGSSEYLGISIKIDNTYLWGEEIGSISSGGQRGVFLQAILNQGGSVSIQKLTGSTGVSDDITAAIAGIGGQDDDEGNYDIAGFRGESSIDWSTAHTVSVVIQLSSSSGSHTFTRDVALIEQL